MAVIQTITFTKDDPNFNADALLLVLDAATGFDDYTAYMQSVTDKFINSWLETTNEVIIERIWVDEDSYTAYLAVQETWDTAFKAVLTENGISVTETVV
jgi:hypothetical protein